MIITVLSCFDLCFNPLSLSLPFPPPSSSYSALLFLFCLLNYLPSLSVNNKSRFYSTIDILLNHRDRWMDGHLFNPFHFILHLYTTPPFVYQINGRMTRYWPAVIDRCLSSGRSQICRVGFKQNNRK